MAQLLKGSEVTAVLNEKLKAEVIELKNKNINPTLGIVRVGERPDDLSY
ncbi:MAG: bifunctional 5,10-methylene-tetrahydrofolate dehydrogenase/5,10-methylene-tetrahydrofolate cyclohydrolase, partial [Oscillospiraceae bacterium]